MPNLPETNSQQSYGFTPLPMRTASPEAGVFEAGAKAGDALTSVMDRINEAQQVTALNTARNQGAIGLANLRGQLEKETDPTKIKPAWDEGTNKLRDDIGGQIADPQVRGAFNGSFARELAGHQIDIVRLMAKRTAEDGNASRADLMDTSIREAAAAPNAAIRQAIDARVIGAVDGGVASGQITAVEGQKLKSHYFSQLDEASARNLVTASPGSAAAALADAKQFPNLQPERRAVMLDMATRRADALADRAVRQAELTERKADRLGRQEANQHANDLWAQIAQAEQSGGPMPTIDDVHKYRDFMSPGETQALLTRIKRTETASDDPATVQDLTVNVDKLDPDSFADRAGRALRSGLLKTDTFRTLVGQNRSARKDDTPASPYRAGRGFVSDALDPGNVVGGNFIRGPLAAARQNALADYDSWAERNPTASRTDAVTQGRTLVDTYQLQALSESRQSIGRPWGYRGAATAVDDKAIGEAIQRLQADRQAGRIAQGDYLRERERLDAWDHVLSAGPAKKPAAKPSNNGRGGVQAQ